MKLLLLSIILLTVGLSEKWSDYPVPEFQMDFFVALGIFFGAYALIMRTYYRSGAAWPISHNLPRPLVLKPTTYLKAMVCWLDAFERTYAIPPGLYYTGLQYDPAAPLLVTANYLLTVFLVKRSLGKRNVRLLVVDTDGINVWCSASKGQFSNGAIAKQLARYKDALASDNGKPTLVLPKLSLAGVDLKSLRNNGIRPIIGPVHAKDLPGFLAQMPLKDQTNDWEQFGLRARLFGWLPSLLQCLGSILSVFAALLLVEQLLGIPAPLEIIGLTALLATLYPILFPWIPGQRSAIEVTKGVGCLFIIIKEDILKLGNQLHSKPELA